MRNCSCIRNGKQEIGILIFLLLFCFDYYCCCCFADRTEIMICFFVVVVGVVCVRFFSVRKFKAELKLFISYRALKITADALAHSHTASRITSFSRISIWFCLFSSFYLFILNALITKMKRNRTWSWKVKKKKKFQNIKKSNNNNVSNIRIKWEFARTNEISKSTHGKFTLTSHLERVFFAMCVYLILFK